MPRAIKFKFGLVCLLFVSLVVSINAKQDSNNDDEEELLDDELRATRRVEISRALALLKKHAIVGKSAKIVLKSRGRHLLVDPSDRLKVVPEVGESSSFSSIARQTLSNIKKEGKKSSKIKDQHASKVKNSKKRSSSGNVSNSKSVSSKGKKRAKSGKI